MQISLHHCPKCQLHTVPLEPFCTRCGFDIRYGELTRPKIGVCWYCGNEGAFTDEHVVARWIIEEAKITQKFTHRIRRPRDRTRIDQPDLVEGKGRLSKRPTIEGQSAPVVCQKCNNGWMSILQRGAMPVLTRLMHGDFRPLSWPERTVLARWVSVATCTAEYMNGIRYIPQYVRSMLMDGGLPGGQFLISMSRPLEASQNGSIFIGHMRGEMRGDPLFDPFLVSMWISFGKVIFSSIVSANVISLWDNLGRFPDFQIKCNLRNIWPLMNEEREDGIGSHSMVQVHNVQHAITTRKFSLNRDFVPSDIDFLI